MSGYYQYLVNGENKGLGNNKNISLTKVQDFPVIEVPLSDQDSIIDDLDTVVKRFDGDIVEAERLRRDIELRLVSAMAL